MEVRYRQGMVTNSRVTVTNSRGTVSNSKGTVINSKGMVINRKDMVMVTTTTYTNMSTIALDIDRICLDTLILLESLKTPRQFKSLLAMTPMRTDRS